MDYFIELSLVLKKPTAEVHSFIVTVTKPLVISVIKISSANIFIFALSSSILKLLRLTSSFRLIEARRGRSLNLMKLKFGYKVPSNLTFLSSCSSSEAIILFKLCFLFDILFLDNGGRISSVEYSLSLLLSN